MKKKKILALSDHALSTSGVGTQSRHLFNGLVDTGKWSIRQFGAALKHSNYDVSVINEDFIIKPIDGFGDRDLLRITLATEQPDVLFIFTDPRFFIWLFEMEDEIHQVCPIAWWHVWDNLPYPSYNKSLYESTDLINCHSYLTYEMINEKFPDKTNFIPHAVPKEIFFPISKKKTSNFKKTLLGESRKDHFVGIWVNRNAKRKRPNDVLVSWSKFLDMLEKEHGHRNATLIMHTDPHDQEGPGLILTAETLGIENNIFFSVERLDFDKMNIIYNICDFSLNISYAEGFGLPTLEAMQAGTPMIAVKTGGLTRQVVDHRDGTENGIAIDVECQTLVGSQQVPFIYEDYCSNDSVAAAIYKLFSLTPSEKTLLSKKCREYALSEFSLDSTISKWSDTMEDLSENWKNNYERWECKTY
jgi:glycosyltransferase involved in cell wall biosynthesis